MKGVKCIKSQKLFTTLALLFVLLFGLFARSSAFALSSDYSTFKLRLRYSTGSSYEVVSDLTYNDMVTQVKYLDLLRADATDLGSVPSNTNYITVSGKLNLVALCGLTYSPVPPDLYNDCPVRSGDPPSIGGVYVNGTWSQFISDNVSVYETGWYRNEGTTYAQLKTFTYEYSFVITNNIPTSLTGLAFTIEYPGRLESPRGSNYIYYFESDSSNKMLVDFTNDKNTAILQQQVQIQQLTLEALNNLNNTTNQQAQQDSQDREDLQNQSDDAQDSADTAADNLNNAKTGLFSVIANFVNIVIHPPADNCVINADMGNMDLGNIDLCQLSLPPAFAVIGTLLIIGFLIPLGYSVISTILSLLKGATQD